MDEKPKTTSFWGSRVTKMPSLEEKIKFKQKKNPKTTSFLDPFFPVFFPFLLSQLNLANLTASQQITQLECLEKHSVSDSLLLLFNLHPWDTIRCTRTNETVLELPIFAKFFVKKIDYKSQVIEVYDPDHCFPRQL
jgi:hypothetical protein